MRSIRRPSLICADVLTSTIAMAAAGFTATEGDPTHLTNFQSGWQLAVPNSPVRATVNRTPSGGPTLTVRRGDTEVLQPSALEPAETSAAPLTTPWRTMIVGDLSTVVGSDLVTDLATPSRVADTSWITARSVRVVVVVLRRQPRNDLDSGTIPRGTADSPPGCVGCRPERRPARPAEAGPQLPVPGELRPSRHRLFPHRVMVAKLQNPFSGSRAPYSRWP